jgi:hypothetical protein
MIDGILMSRLDFMRKGAYGLGMKIPGRREDEELKYRQMERDGIDREAEFTCPQFVAHESPAVPGESCDKISTRE